MSATDDDDQRTPAVPSSRAREAPARPSLKFTWTRTGVDRNGQSVRVCVGATRDHRVVVEIAGRVAYFSKKRAVIMARGVRLALRDGVPQRFAGDDEHWQTADLRVAVTEDQRVSFEVPGGVAYFSKNDARDVSTGLRLAIGQLGPEDRWCS